MDDQKKRAELLAAKRRADFAKGQAELRSSESNVFDHTLRDSDKMEVKGGDHWQAQLDAKRKAARISRGLPAEIAENVYDAGDYKRQMMKGGKEILRDSRKGIKSLSKGLKSIPIIGALASLMSAEDASAAVPILDSADAVGMSPQDENVMMGEIQAQKDYGNSQSHQDRLAALAKLAKMRGQ